MVKKIILSAVLIAAAGMLGAVSSAGAQTVVASGNVVKGEPGLDVQVVFTPGTGTLGVQINNLGGISSDSEAIYGITFDVPGDETVDPSKSSGSGTSFTVTNGQGIPSSTSAESWSTMQAPSGKPSDNPPWITSQSGQKVSMSIDGSQPDYMVIGPPSGTPAAYNVTPSVTNMNPFLESGGSFALSVSGMTASSAVSNVQVFYGTGGLSTKYWLPGTPESSPLGPPNSPTPAPIPATLPLLGGGLLGLGLICLRKRRRLSPQNM
ncbi:MAG: hypothetical protein ACP5I8_12885 [Phycisphaerae bacterium]